MYGNPANYNRQYRRTRGRKRRRRRPGAISLRRPRLLGQRGGKAVQIPQLTEEERHYVNTVANPFGVGRAQRSRSHYFGGRILDPSGMDTLPVTLTSKHSFTVDANRTKGLIKIAIPQQSANDAMYIYASNDDSVIPTSQVAAPDFDQYDQYLAVTRKFRLVGCGLKVRAVSTHENTSGWLQAGLCRAAVKAGADYVAYAAFEQDFEPQIEPMTSGITIRWAPEGNEDFEWQDVQDYGAPVAQQATEERMPCIIWHNAVAGTQLLVEMVMHLEVVTNVKSCPFVLTPSPSSLRWSLLVMMVSHPHFAPLVTAGNSFRNFFANARAFTKKVAGWVMKYGPTAIRVAKKAAAVL